MNPPIIAELLLAASVPNPEVRESLLGDLCEEWHDRVHFDGARSANRWYWMETAYTLPHLMQLSWRDQRWYARPLPPIIALALFALGIILGYAGIAGIAATARALGITSRVVTTIPATAFLVISAMAMGALCAWIARGTLLVTLALLVAMYALLDVVANGLVDAAFTSPAWYVLGQHGLALPALVCGSLIVVRRRISRSALQ